MQQWMSNLVTGYLEPWLLWIAQPSSGPAIAGFIFSFGLIIVLITVCSAFYDVSLIWHARREIGVDVSEKQFALQYNLIDQNLSGDDGAFFFKNLINNIK